MAERFEARWPFYWTGFDGVRVVLGTILLTAAALKAQQLVTDPLLAAAGSWERWFSIGVVQFELFLGLWLLSGIYPRAVWGVSLAVFSLFCVVAFAKLVLGAENCGCLGQVAVPPWVMLVIDLGAVALLLRFKPLATPPPQENRPDFRRPGAAMAAVFLVMLSISTTLVLATHRPGRSLSNGLWMDRDRVIVAQPQAWRGAEFPLLDLAGCGERLRQGVWNVIVYAADCGKCAVAISWAMEHQKRIASSGGEPGLALLAIPPHEHNVACRDAGTHLAAQLDASRVWFIKTPLILRLSDGRVTAVSNDVADVLSDGEIFHRSTATASQTEDVQSIRIPVIYYGIGDAQKR